MQWRSTSGEYAAANLKTMDKEQYAMKKYIITVDFYLLQNNVMQYTNFYGPASHGCTKHSAQRHAGYVTYHFRRNKTSN